MRQVGHVQHTGQFGNAYRIVARNAEEKRPLRKLCHRWVNNIKTDLKQDIRVWAQFI
jgi:RNA binding exosome subunit